ncbi:Holliday junction resolvase RuvX [Candidatus Saccharibacteria bacterium]|nr:MAG: Holliday junction resolvase RuvX [Candidatus Saccharibacteria bacterium]
MAAHEYILGIDYGSKRIGLALAHQVARLPRPLKTLPASDTLFADLQKTITAEDVGLVVVGVPRNLDGSESAQSQACEAFARSLESHIDLPVATADETLSSEEAISALNALGKTYTKADIDAASAALILQRYFDEGETRHGV